LTNPSRAELSFYYLGHHPQLFSGDDQSAPQSELIASLCSPDSWWPDLLERWRDIGKYAIIKRLVGPQRQILSRMLAVARLLSAYLDRLVRQLEADLVVRSRFGKEQSYATVAAADS
jgi:hypothetical protein